ncbi:hypothetical protein LTR99_005977 [Exophiala xenobiotica]|uniref:Uncharacterized protein n=1 Tax=Vermiconidia calcicola TaxID=1690605 RepID=A0AAV9QGZ9_9PEZI|nr:hypothetical protein LTR72_005802 [Exophiala xenobiotica]KAK5540951.1 hypothetical protein LTR25_002728 [Vermiconidia calcicola]KAK5549558.1 hypothetical protein LTR23_000666 [Chaetothyriales sp. CCFEE 6169]KAK5267064.1 hypothetical protein LTR96_007731 [Exophiala xenobiotica]KAK5297216.1 hypothetical protein LTR14_002947 [Exophiala xenobiotica]
MSGSHSRSQSRQSLEVPRKSIELVDPGAHELSSEGEEDHFSDASEGQKISRPVTPVSPIPRTRIEKVDDEPRHGEVPGTPAYDKRAQDAVPDEVAILSPNNISRASLEAPTTPGGTLIPRTVIEKVDPESPSYGEVPGTPAYQQRRMDAAPDVVLKTPDPTKRRPHAEDTDQEASTPHVPVPETVITRVDSEPAHGEVPGTAAYEKRTLDAAPDIVEVKSDEAGSPTFDSPMKQSRRRSTLGNDDNDGNDFGDDFDDFEEGAQAGADDDFGDFDDEFQEPEAEAEDATASPVTTSQINQIPAQPFPLIDFDRLSSVPELLAATQAHLDAMFPSSTNEKLSSIPSQEPIPDSSPIFPSDRSRSLWKQLITPPPLQPPNWTQSRIRRLFLVSLGVPVDLDEILPPSKQKKLVLPDINLEPSSRKSESEKTLGSVARLKAQAANDSTGSVDSTQSGTTKERRSKRPKGPPPPPELDLMAVKRLCATTDEKLDGFTEEELRKHVKDLQDFTEKTSELLEYWLKQRDGLRKEKEAFEGVIENLVRHARRVRK